MKQKLTYILEALFLVALFTFTYLLILIFH